jgi:plastocyanin
MKKAAALLVLVLVSALVLAACGSSSDDTSSTPAESGTESESAAGSNQGAGESGGGGGGGAATALKFEAEPGSALAYTSDKATAKAGKVTIEFNNPQQLSHDVAIEDSSGKEVGETELVADGTATSEVDLKPGTYTFFCTVPGHREGGMEGKLTVK